MKDILLGLNKTPGVLGSAYLHGDREIADLGEAVGGIEALPLARKAADVLRGWSADGGAPLEAAVFAGTEGRILVRAAGGGYLVAFAENDSAAGLLKMRMRDAAKEMNAGTTTV
jgi:predicted regulator of Ras-like GTPase activity (Roadblock/LC7/MglB family)